MRNLRGLLLVVGILGLMSSAAYIIAGKMHPHDRGAAVTTTQKGSTATAPAATTPVQTAVPKTAGPPKKVHAKDAVAAAALAMSNLSQAQLLPAEQIRQVVDSTVVPDKRQVLTQGLQTAGPYFAKFLGYRTIDDARLSAQYTIDTRKYRIAAFQDHHATIWLYTITHWINGSRLEYNIPDMRVIQMRWIRGRWLYVNAHDPPAKALPAPKAHLTFEESVRRFQPYLRGFKPYEG